MGGSVEVRPVAGVGPMLDEVFRAEWARVVAALVGFCRDVDVAEDAAQEAFAIAARRWPVERDAGQPEGVAGRRPAATGPSTASAATAPSPRSSASSRRPAEVPTR